MNTDSTLTAPLKTFKNIQVLRAVAAILVVFQHLGGPITGIEYHYFPGQPRLLSPFSFFGLFGVDIFFVISGFIMITTTAKQFAKSGASLRFFAKRCIRIYPPYWLVFLPMMLVYLLAPARLTQFHPVHDNLLASFLLLPQINHPLVAVSWTLVFEMYFYAIFSSMLFLQFRAVVPAMAAWFCIQIGFFFAFNHSDNAYLYFLGNPISIEFIFGVIVGLLYLRNALPSPSVTFGIAVIACCVLWGFSFQLGDMPGIERIFVWGIPAALLVCGAVGLENKGRVASFAWAITLGDASYALYLWHLPILIGIAQVVSKFHVRSLPIHAIVVAAMLAILLVVTTAIYRYIERPMTRYLNGLLAAREAASALREKAA